MAVFGVVKFGMRKAEGITRLTRKGFLEFKGLEVRGARDLSHVGESTLRKMEEGDIVSKILRNMMQMDARQLATARKEPLQRLAIDEAAQLLKAHLIYIALHDAGQTVEAVGDALQAQQEEWKHAHGGKGFDLLVADYPAKLFSSHEIREERQRLDYVYNYFVQLALEHQWHSLVPIQANREGSRSNRGTTAKKSERRVLLDPESVSEAYGPVCTAANVITLNRPTDADYITYYIGKSRSSQTGWAVLCESNFAAATTHRESSPCCRYRDNVQPGPWAAQAIEKYRGRVVPPGAITDEGIVVEMGSPVRQLAAVPKEGTQKARELMAANSRESAAHKNRARR